MNKSRQLQHLTDAIIYNKFFYHVQAERAKDSAQVVVPLIQELVRLQSVVDVGCGVGHWAATFHEYGVPHYLGIDGSWVPRRYLAIPEDHFLEHDLTSASDISGHYDLVVSLEVAEHLPERYARQFVHLLTSLGDIVMFSAAIPEQGGGHHVNEQWQSYWADIFATVGYVAVDCIRPKVWTGLVPTEHAALREGRSSCRARTIADGTCLHQTRHALRSPS
jgi:2-polyprenyl-3-methyl-5-hydroxy-6-metoxy-1,4-benzoquinol methylase